MKFSLQKLRAETPLQFEEDVDVSELEEMNNDIRRIPPVHVKGEATVRGEHITLQFDITGMMVLPCARTLVDVEYPFSISCIEVFSTSPYHKEDDDEIHGITGEVLDLVPYIKENILLEVPLQVFASNDDETSKSPEEGRGWKLVDEMKQEEQKVDPRLEKLSQFFDKK
ncbi:YceD family protein [Salirhabdus sp. Marseille-P4669]|uniref:YceD family protein n=1 Tax=Salirhabdus sp. Marseille-P4669 TaxID=2042310 RepID=UPI000C7D2EB2|nr:YceD family protein [Salirhabdus sp. Marseille-P4669]